ncbi:MAG: hypothetical protein CTY35_03425 [Methylotenera sp.]|nr:MAG: hypothetical protein CTY35_03425 [Methylotenera sp.]
MQVLLAHANNPDIEEGYWETPEDPPAAVLVNCRSFEHASLICREYIVRNGLGAGNWTGGNVFENNEQIGYVSYNGRTWDMNHKEIQ